MPEKKEELTDEVKDQEDSQPLEEHDEKPNEPITTPKTTSEPSKRLSIEATEYNTAIKKPWLDKIKLSGTVELQFTELRMKELDELRDPD